MAPKESQQRKDHPQCTSKKKPFFFKRSNCAKNAKKAKVTSVSVVVKTTRSKSLAPPLLVSISEEEKGGRDETPSKTSYEVAATVAGDDDKYDAMKKVLSSWREVKRQSQRKDAGLKLEQIKNTAGFEHNMEAMHDFHKLIGCPVSYPTYTRSQCFGGRADECEGLIHHD